MDQLNLGVASITNKVFRLCATDRPIDGSDGGLRRYDVLPELPNGMEYGAKASNDAGTARVDRTGGEIAFTDTAGKKRLLQHTTEVPSSGSGFRIAFRLEPGEELYGLGDVTRDRLNKRGYATQIWVRNVESYVPNPIILSSRGWALFVETTWRHYIDLDSEGTGELTIWCHGGTPAYLVTLGADLKELLDAMTEVIGRPTLLPLSGYGLTFVCNQQADARAMLDNCLAFRDREIPCDTIGLEPGWMSKNYDFSVDKEWHPERFRIPHWSPKGPHTFLGAADRLGFKMSLWLCCDYDLSEIEERWIAEAEKGDAGEAEASEDAGEQTVEERLRRGADHGHHPVHMDRLTRRGEAWFEHLKKFVDQGVSAFKLDGAVQVNEHPDRKWANGMSDEEMHNLYPALLNKQMSRGFEEHTNRRSMIYSSGGYAGIQRFSATWAGDTGGGTGPLVSMLNHGLSGHSNTSCDMDVFSKQGIHFGFLMPWAQACSWAYWKHPWLLGEEMEAVFADYARLRYRLLPYIYSAAHTAHRTGTPIMRAMHLQFPEDDGCRERLSQYMLGDTLLVGTFEPEVYLPDVPGGWTDFWTGERYDGGDEIEPAIPEDRGGPLLVRAGSIVPMWEVMPYVGKRVVDTVELHVFAADSGVSAGSTGAGHTVLYEDDGVTPAYRDGKVAVTRIALSDSGSSVRIGPREGSYDGMPDTRTFHVIVHTDQSPEGLKPIEVSPPAAESVDVSW